MGRSTRSLLYRDIVDSIKQMIIEMDLHPGDQLPTEEKLCERFGVSRTIIREAMKILEAQGLLEMQRGKGIFLAQPLIGPTVEQLFFRYRSDGGILTEIIDMRLIIECGAIDLVLRNIDDNHLRAMEENIKVYEELMSREEFDMATSIDMDFHRIFLDTSGNRLLRSFGFALLEFTLRFVWPPWKKPKSLFERTLNEHRQIYRALKQRERQLLFDTLMNHLTIKKRDIEEAMRINRSLDFLTSPVKSP